MAHDVFISHSSDDKTKSDAVCSLLESRGLRCWIAPRDVQPGDTWARAIAEAIKASRAMVVVISRHANTSPHVMREVELAVRNGVVIVPFRTETVELSEELCYFLEATHWLDAVDAPLETAIGKLATCLELLLDPATPAKDASDPPPPDNWWRRLVNLFKPPDGSDPEPEPKPKPPEPSADAVVAAPSEPELDPTSTVVLVPPFHFGNVVPPDYFVGRGRELEDGKDLLRARQSFLLVGDFRSGKTSYGHMLIHQLKNENAHRGCRILGASLDLQSLEMRGGLTADAMLSHTVLSMAGEIARTIFNCKFGTLKSMVTSKNPVAALPEWRDDRAFAAMLDTFRAAVNRTHATDESGTPEPLHIDEFVEFVHDFVDIMREKGWDAFFIFYDEANRLPVELSDDLLRHNEEALSTAGVVSVYSVIPKAAALPALRRAYGRQIRLGPLASVDDVRTLLTRYYFHANPRPGDLPVTDAATEALLRLSRGRLFGLQVLAGNSFAVARHEGATVVTEDHIQQAYETLRQQRHTAFED